MVFQIETKLFSVNGTFERDKSGVVPRESP